ncbi:hypothetical protein ACHQM5_004144 [Ranunculus cassubicifolius]
MIDLMTKSFGSYVGETMKDLEAAQDPYSVETAHLEPNVVKFLEEVENVLGKIQAPNEESKSLHKPEPLKALRNRINGDSLTVLKKATAIRSMIEEMDRENEDNRRLSGYREDTSVSNGMRKKLKELMMGFQELRQQMMSVYRDMVGGTVTGENPSEDVIEKLSGEEGGVEGAIPEHGRGEVLETVVEIKARVDSAEEVDKRSFFQGSFRKRAKCSFHGLPIEL